jgi:hypothetical protein
LNTVGEAIARARTAGDFTLVGASLSSSRGKFDNIRCVARICGVLAMILMAQSPPVFAQAASAAPTQRQVNSTLWRQDLHYLVGQIEKVHPHPFHHVPETQFAEAVATLDRDIPSLSDHEVEIRIAELVAMLGEGHSRLSLAGLTDPMSDVQDITPAKDPSLAFHRLPVKLRLFADGLFVVGATPDYRGLVGDQVVKIGGRSAEAALDDVKPMISRDNEMGARLIGPELVAIPEVLAAFHITADDARTPLTVRTPRGDLNDVVLSPLPVGPIQGWMNAGDVAHMPGADRGRHSDDNLWVEYHTETKTLVAGANVINDSPRRSVAAFAARLETLTASRPVVRFVIDLRDCHGGDNSKFRALLLAIVRDRALNRLGRMFVLINRATFSAAVNSASDLERLSNAIFVGEPTAGAPSSWGDPRKIVLPNTGLIVRISSVYWRDWTPNEARPWIAPDIAVATTSADYFSGKDREMTELLRFPLQMNFADVLNNLVRAGADGNSVLRLYYQRKNDPDWAGENTEHAMETTGTAFLARKSYGDAFLMFAVNARDYPASLTTAIATVKAALNADPSNEDLKQLTDRLLAISRHAQQTIRA